MSEPQPESPDGAGTLVPSAAPASPATSARARVAAALLSLYVIWGSTFLAIRVALDGFPPLLMAALRFLCAGAILYAAQRLRGARRPTLAQWRGAAVVGVLLCGANGLVVVAEQWVSSGVAAVAIASVSLWAALFAGLFGRWPRRSDWVGLAVGFCGVALLQFGADLRASPAGAVLLLVSASSWALGSMWSRSLPLPEGLLASAVQMLCGGVALLVAALARGERLAAVPGPGALVAFVYLVAFGSVVGYSAYNFLLASVRPAVATSYAYVNPVVAVALGALVLGEKVSPAAAGALALILVGVGVVMSQRRG
jgi:drug/metabolite transporter (DMT)-like permease